jgi:3-methyladenine DNA glycosylase AlkD
MNTIEAIQGLLQQHVNVARQNNPMFFKTGPGEYAEHDKFLGVSVPVVRAVSKQFALLSLDEITALLSSPYNEERLLALFIIVLQYQKVDKQQQKLLYDYYVQHLQYVNNWNLVDQSAHMIMGAYLFEHDQNKEILARYAQSNNLWERRIAIIATWYFIKKLDFGWTFKIAKLLLHDKHDLIHKAVGWMLREVGNKDITQLKLFLDEHAAIMPRTMLRYAIEKLPQDERLSYLKKK